MIFPEILGQERARAVLARMLSSRRIPHALLFHGPEAVGKGLTARLFAASLTCTDPAPDGAGCGTCTSCLKVAHGNHPDVLLVTRLPKKERAPGAEADDASEDPEDAGGGHSGELRGFIVVQQIRELTHHASFAPREAPVRVFIVDPADRMNAESQNALLKTLEEPAGRAVIVLVAARPHVLLPTVRSRCFQVGFGAMPSARLAEELVARGLDPKEARTRSALASGRPGHAIALDLAALAGRRDRILEMLRELVESPRGLAGLAEHAGALVGEGESDLLEGLDLVTTLLRDAARLAAGRDAILNSDCEPEIAALARRLGARRASEIVELVDRLRGDLRLNLNRTLVCETILAAVAGGPVAFAG